MTDNIEGSIIIAAAMLTASHNKSTANFDQQTWQNIYAQMLTVIRNCLPKDRP